MCDFLKNYKKIRKKTTVHKSQTFSVRICYFLRYIQHSCTNLNNRYPKEKELPIKPIIDK